MDPTHSLEMINLFVSRKDL
jgi:hypothetical protein